MSVNISLSRIDKLATDALLDSILDGSFQANANKRIPELFDELEKYPPITDEEIFMPMHNTPEAITARSERLGNRSRIKDELKLYGWLPGHIDHANELRHKPQDDEFTEWVNAIVADVVGLNSESFFSPLWDVQICVDLLFKHAGRPAGETDYLDKIPFASWCAVLNNIDKSQLQSIKDDIETNHEDYDSFDEFVETLKEIRSIQKSCDGENLLFSVEVEDEGNHHYEDSLAEKIKTHLKEGPLDPIHLQGRKIDVFG